MTAEVIGDKGITPNQKLMLHFMLGARRKGLAYEEGFELQAKIDK